MAKWAGFSSAELNEFNGNNSDKIQSSQQTKLDGPTTAVVKPAVRKVVAQRSHRQHALRPSVKKQSSQWPNAGDPVDMQAARLGVDPSQEVYSKTRPPSDDSKDAGLPEKTTAMPSCQDSANNTGEGEGASNSDKPTSGDNKNRAENKQEATLDDKIGDNLPSKQADNENIKATDKIQQFQQKQKQIEEMNKKKKQALSTEIVSRQRAAMKESQKMADLQKQLSKMDEQLTVDVSAIRDEIEAASYEYTDARSRYEAAEKELIAAKCHLFLKTEAKERLTEKLYLVITRNEQLKAKRLASLASELHLDSAEETIISVEVPPLIPAVESKITTPRPSEMSPPPTNNKEKSPKSSPVSQVSCSSILPEGAISPTTSPQTPAPASTQAPASPHTPDPASIQAPDSTSTQDPAVPALPAGPAAPSNNSAIESTPATDKVSTPTSTLTNITPSTPTSITPTSTPTSITPTPNTTSASTPTSTTHTSNTTSASTFAT